MNRARILPIVVALALLLVGGLGTTQAQGPLPQGGDPEAIVGSIFTYQGQLNRDGSPVNDTCDMEFKLYDAAGGGAQVGATLTRTGVSVSGGLFTIPNLGFGPDVFTGDARWLEVAVKCTGDAAYVALTPLQALTAAPYALSLRPGAEIKGAVAAGLTVEGQITGLLATATNATGVAYGVHGFSDSPDGYGVGGNALTYGVYGRSEATSGDGYGVYGRAGSSDGSGVYGYNSSASGTAYGVYGLSISTAGHGVHGANSATTGTTYGVWGEVDAPNGRGVFGRNNATTGGSEGVYGAVYSPDGRGILGINYAITGMAWGVYGRSDSTDGIGVYGLNEQTTGTTYGVYGESDSPNGYGMYGTAPLFGVFGETTSTGGGWGVYGYSPATTGYGRGVYGRSASTSGRGVYGVASAASGTTYGVYGEVDSTSGRGVYGVAGATTGFSFGVYGEATSPNGTGVYGQSPECGVYGEAVATTGSTYGVFASSFSNEGIGVATFVQGTDAWAGDFYADTFGNGVRISSPSGGVGLTVAGGTKNAVVATAGGSRLLYTEESTEVWFTDYGFGQLQEGQATIAIDPLFAQTVNLDEPYHVYVTALGDQPVLLYISERTAVTFTVRGVMLDGRPADGAFDYRLVAKRLGYEDDRLEPAPWADDDPNLYPEKRAEWEAEHNFGGER